MVRVNVLEAKESPIVQGADEILVYTIDATGWTTSPAATVVTAFDEADNSGVTSTLFPTNSPTESSAVITLSALRALTAGKSYRIEVLFTDGGSNTFEMFFRVRCPL